MPHTPARFDLTGPDGIIQGEDWTWPLGLLVDCLPAPPFAANTPYVVGNYVSPTVATGFTYLVVVAGTPAAEPVWPTVAGGKVTQTTTTFMAVGPRRLLDTATCLARFTIRETDGTLVLRLSTSPGGADVGYDPPAWALGTVYGLGQQVVPTTTNGWVYECVKAGTSNAATEPIWPTTPGATCLDNTVVWRNVRTDELVSNLRITIPAVASAALAGWGAGQYDIELIDAFGHTTRIIEGYAVLSPEQSH